MSREPTIRVNRYQFTCWHIRTWLFSDWGMQQGELNVDWPVTAPWEMWYVGLRQQEILDKAKQKEEKCTGIGIAHTAHRHTLDSQWAVCDCRTPVMLLLAASVKMAFHQAADKWIISAFFLPISLPLCLYLPASLSLSLLCLSASVSHFPPAQWQ